MCSVSFTLRPLKYVFKQLLLSHRHSGVRMEEKQHKCSECHQVFSVKSNLTRHMKTHEEKGYHCVMCGKAFTLKQNLDSHSRQHLYPAIPLYKPGVAQLKCTEEALKYSELCKETKTVESVWTDPTRAETAAKKTGGSLWRANIVITFGKYAGKTLIFQCLCACMFVCMYPMYTHVCLCVSV